MADRMTVAELRAAQAGSEDRRRVRGAQRTESDGVEFASKREARRWGELCLLQKAGQIACLERQVPIELQGQNGPIPTPTGRPMRYVADFRYIDQRSGLTVIEDAKGHETDTFRMKRAILAAMGIEVVTS